MLSAATPVSDGTPPFSIYLTRIRVICGSCNHLAIAFVFYIPRACDSSTSFVSRVLHFYSRLSSAINLVMTTGHIFFIGIIGLSVSAIWTPILCVLTQVVFSFMLAKFENYYFLSISTSLWPAENSQTLRQ